jgi:hypothetical protein
MQTDLAAPRAARDQLVNNGTFAATQQHINMADANNYVPVFR